MIKKTTVWVLIVIVMLASMLMLGSCDTGVTEQQNQSGSGNQTSDENGTEQQGDAGDSNSEQGSKTDGGQNGQAGGKNGEAGGQKSSKTIKEDGTYDQKDDVAKYLSTYKKLPKNYIKKKEAKRLGWTGGSVEQVAPGKALGGDYFGNYEKKLPKKKGRTYYECDIDTLGKKNRGPKRMIWSDDGLIYYTGDHYKTFQKMPESA